MRHRNSGRKLGRKSGPRRALERAIVQALFLHGRIVTTVARAKEFRSPAEKLITLARRGNAAKEGGDAAAHMHCFRQAVATLGGNRTANALAKQLFEEIAPQFRDRPGGYTRVVRHWRGRLGDNAPQAVFELVGYSPAAPAVEAEGGEPAEAGGPEKPEEPEAPAKPRGSAKKGGKKAARAGK